MLRNQSPKLDRAASVSRLVTPKNPRLLRSLPSRNEHDESLQHPQQRIPTRREDSRLKRTTSPGPPKARIGEASLIELILSSGTRRANHYLRSYFGRMGAALESHWKPAMRSVRARYDCRTLRRPHFSPAMFNMASTDASILRKPPVC